MKKRKLEANWDCTVFCQKWRIITLMLLLLSRSFLKADFRRLSSCLFSSFSFFSLSFIWSKNKVSLSRASLIACEPHDALNQKSMYGSQSNELNCWGRCWNMLKSVNLEILRPCKCSILRMTHNHRNHFLAIQTSFSVSRIKSVCLQNCLPQISTPKVWWQVRFALWSKEDEEKWPENLNKRGWVNKLILLWEICGCRWRLEKDATIFSNRVLFNNHK